MSTVNSKRLKAYREGFAAAGGRVSGGYEPKTFVYLEFPDNQLRYNYGALGTEADPRVGDYIQVDGIEYKVTKRTWMPALHPTQKDLVVTLEL